MGARIRRISVQPHRADIEPWGTLGLTLQSRAGRLGDRFSPRSRVFEHISSFLRTSFRDINLLGLCGLGVYSFALKKTIE